MTTPVKAIFFDFMGTCLDWHTSIMQALPSDLSDSQKSTFALHWRQAYFDYNARRLANGERVENFDETQRKVLDSFLLQPEHSDIKHLFTPEIKTRLVAAWHNQPAWPDVSPAIKRAKADNNLEAFVHANGSTRLQLDIVRSAGLQGHFDMLFSSELLGLYKPSPEMYRKGLELLNLRPEEVVMVAAHAYDLRGAKAVGMKTVYIYRWTDDIHEDQAVIRRENDAYLDGMDRLSEVIAGFR